MGYTDRDKIRHGTLVIPRGEQNGNAKLTAEQVAVIRRRYKGPNTRWRRVGPTTAELAEEYGVSSVLIGLIVRRKAWR
jgi:hypothetical protein